MRYLKKPYAISDATAKPSRVNFEVQRCLVNGLPFIELRRCEVAVPLSRA
jgi:hypothetical protein